MTRPEERGKFFFVPSFALNLASKANVLGPFQSPEGRSLSLPAAGWGRCDRSSGVRCSSLGFAFVTWEMVLIMVPP